MTDFDDTLRDDLRRAAPSGDPPSFGVVWSAAERRFAARRLRHRVLAGAAIVAAVAVFVTLRAPVDDSVAYIEVADVLESTYWSAPSDVLLPERQFDIYQEIPVLMESTEPAGGALL